MCEMNLKAWSNKTFLIVSKMEPKSLNITPEGDLKTEPSKIMKNDAKLLPQGSQMGWNGDLGKAILEMGGVGATLSIWTYPHYRTHVLTYRSHPLGHLFDMILGSMLVIS